MNLNTDETASIVSRNSREPYRSKRTKRGKKEAGPEWGPLPYDFG